MFSGDYKNIKADPQVRKKYRNVELRWLVAKKHGARNFAMRHVTIEPGKSPSPHMHPQDHQMFFLRGKGLVESGGEVARVKRGTFVFIPGGTEHAVTNSGRGPLEFICCVSME
jgi:quercetin dioxygenase-like cupin family protein